MDAVSRLDHNFTYKGPTEDIGDLSCIVEGNETITHWRPTRDELEVLMAGGLVELTLLSHPIPPIMLTTCPADQPEVIPPFKRLEPGDE